MLSLIKNNNIVWEIKSKSQEHLDGMLTGLGAIMSPYNCSNSYKNNLFLKIDKDSSKDSFLTKISFEYWSKLDKNLNLKETPFTLLLKNRINSINVKDIHYVVLSDQEFGWYIHFNSSLKDIIFQFKTYDFVQGFIDICDQFELDFRNYINGTPFKKVNTENKIDEVVFYQIEGYDVLEFDKNNNKDSL